MIELRQLSKAYNRGAVHAVRNLTFEVKKGELLGGGCLSAALAVLLAVILLPRLLSFADRQFAGGIEMSG